MLRRPLPPRQFIRNPPDLPIRSNADSTVTLKDVAQVHRTFYDPTSYARMDGRPTIAIDVTKRIGSNIIQNNQLVRDLVQKAAKSWPAGVHADFMFDESTDIRDQLGSLSDSIISIVSDCLGWLTRETVLRFTRSKSSDYIMSRT